MVKGICTFFLWQSPTSLYGWGYEFISGKWADSQQYSEPACGSALLLVVHCTNYFIFQWLCFVSLFTFQYFDPLIPPNFFNFLLWITRRERLTSNWKWNRHSEREFIIKKICRTNSLQKIKGKYLSWKEQLYLLWLDSFDNFARRSANSNFPKLTIFEGGFDADNTVKYGFVSCLFIFYFGFILHYFIFSIISASHYSIIFFCYTLEGSHRESWFWWRLKYVYHNVGWIPSFLSVHAWYS